MKLILGFAFGFIACLLLWFWWTFETTFTIVGG